MLFLVMGENIDPGYLLPPDQALGMAEQLLVPSFQMLAQDSRVTGGVYPGERAGAFIIEMDSVEELDRYMNSLPMFGVIKFTVRPLMPLASVAQQLPEYIQHARQMMQQGGAPGGGQTG